MNKVNKFLDKFKHKSEPENSHSVYADDDSYMDQELSSTSYSSNHQQSEQTTVVKKFYPASYNDLQQAVDSLKENKHVVISFEDMNDEDFKRSLNFMSGFVYATNGSINKISPKVIEFLIRK